ncbi:MAG: N-acetyl-gamma-glutamyl-phosphate reductase [Deltaproteobacteria bacterium GWA2_54_12]|nr:MAG: N-acetyl-gamma-glutamyl-phosphate reductase [Deltaproteobacteria bacterium GWA2_54_12]
MLKAAIFGASGYTGLELLRILANHPDAKVVEATSRQYKGTPIPEVFPALRGFYDDLLFSDPEDLGSVKADVAFSAMPHGASQDVVPELLKKNRVIDLSADFRLHDKDTYNAWYGEHKAAHLLSEAVYGLPELYRKDIKGARLVANPGCYPTSAILALAPLAKKGLIKTGSAIIDSKSGVSGAGRGATLATSFVEASSGFKAYKVGSHRHTPEIEQELTIAAGGQLGVRFTPHLIPVSRGILTTAYAELNRTLSNSEMRDIYIEAYSNERFVRLLPDGSFPDISQVRGSNFCDIGLFIDGSRVTVVSAIDNLVKGASGQAVQNMNIMFGLDEKAALFTPPLSI